MPQTTPSLEREEIIRVLRRHRGSQRQIADSLNIRESGVAQWLKGRTTSARIAKAAEKKARELLSLEVKERQADVANSAA